MGDWGQDIDHLLSIHSRWRIAGEAWASQFLAYMQRDASFWDITYCLLCRYDAMCGPGHKEGGGFHAAIPSTAFHTLETMEDVSGRVECFASPQLCHGEKWNFCSVFPDLDIFFGSLGPFLDEEMDIGRFGGMYEINPPFVRGVVLRLAEKLLKALERAELEDRTLCIFLVLPGLTRHKSISNPGELEVDALDELLRCRFRRAFHACVCRPYTNGLAFKTEKAWPQFAVPTSLALFTSLERNTKDVDFEQLCTTWKHIEQEIDDQKMEKKSSILLLHKIGDPGISMNLCISCPILGYFIIETFEGWTGQKKSTYRLAILFHNRITFLV